MKVVAVEVKDTIFPVLDVHLSIVGFARSLRYKKQKEGILLKSPIVNQINTIFVHVSDLKRSVQWYSRLLGQEYDLEMVVDPVHNIVLNHHTGLTLDAGPAGVAKSVKPGEYPLFNFHTEEIESAFSFVVKMGCQVASMITIFDDFSFFTVRDPDGHVIMICTG
jgi:predicted enzyme related to lactoylglutathione lyase